MKTKLIFRSVTIVIILAAAFISTRAADWKLIQGTNPYINKIFFPGGDANKVIVASDAFETDFSKMSVDFPTIGHGYKFSNNGGESFADFDTALVYFSVYDILQVPGKESTWLAAVKYFGNGGIVVSTDNGSTWSKDNLRMSSSSQAIKLAAGTSGGKTRVYGAKINTLDGDGFVYSENEFVDYSGSDSLHAELRDIEVSRANQSLVFAAADNFIPGKEGVYHTYNNGASWIKDVDGIKNLRILCVHPMSNNPAIVFCGADTISLSGKNIGKGIYMSRDTGNTWVKVGVPGFAVYDIVEHPTNPNYLVAACDIGGVYISSNGGLSWGPINDGLPSGESVRIIGVPNIDANSQGITAFAGVYGKGLYKSARIISSVDESRSGDGFKIISTSPLTACTDLVIRFYNPKPANMKIYLTDYLGRQVTDMVNESFADGEQAISLYFGNNVPSVYNLVITDGTNVTTHKMISIR